MTDKLDNRVILNRIYHSHWIRRYLVFIFGLIITAISYNLFTRKCNLIYGMGGIAIIFHKLFSIEPFIVILIGNIILLIMSFIILGREATRNTIIGSLLYPLLVKAFDFLYYIDLGDIETILLAGCGSIVTGLGLGLVFKAGYTTGGTDILNQIVSKYAKVSVGKSMYATDLLIILPTISLFGFATCIYSILNLYIISLITDKVILGISSSKAFYIITQHETAVKRFITQNLSHGVTVLEARGGYTGNMEKIIMCIVPTKEYFMFKEGIKLIDKDAFFIVTDAYEVSGGK